MTETENGDRRLEKILDNVLHIEDYIKQVERNIKPRNMSPRTWKNMMDYSDMLKKAIPEKYSRTFEFKCGNPGEGHKFKIGKEEIVVGCNKRKCDMHEVKFNAAEMAQETCLIFNFFGNSKHGSQKNQLMHRRMEAELAKTMKDDTLHTGKDRFMIKKMVD